MHLGRGPGCNTPHSLRCVLDVLLEPPHATKIDHRSSSQWRQLRNIEAEQMGHPMSQIASFPESHSLQDAPRIN
eukprot:7341066-Prymnesium_polylepis.1